MRPLLVINTFHLRSKRHNHVFFIMVPVPMREARYVGNFFPTGCWVLCANTPLAQLETGGLVL
jgi:hypothetical protein